MSNEHISKQAVEEGINKATYWMKEYIREWESYSESSVDIPAAKAEAMEIALNIVDRYIKPVCNIATTDQGTINRGEATWLTVLTNEPWKPGQFGKCSHCSEINDASVRRMPKFCPDCGYTMTNGG